MVRLSENLTAANDKLSKALREPHGCICQRPYKHILCNNCGYLMIGRVSYKCPVHLMVKFLIDITNCPNCKSSYTMLREFDSIEDKMNIAKVDFK